MPASGGCTAGRRASVQPAAGTLVEWSLDAVGWLAAFTAQAAARHGMAGPLFLTVDRPE